MSNRRLTDTNIIVRHLTQDHPKHAHAAGELFAACDRGELTLVVPSAVLAECVFVLNSFYKHPRANIATILAALIATPGIEIADLEAHLDALRRYSATKLHFIDCLIASYAAAQKIPVASFDADFQAFKDVRVDIN